MTKILTGVGSRETPKPILDLIRKVSKKLVLSGYTLRSGGADGADTAFYEGWLGAYKEDQDVPEAEIYLPWNGFNNHKTGKNYLVVDDKEILSQAEELVNKIHPAGSKLSRGAKALHTRNCFQVLGRELSIPSTLFLCYAKVDSKGEPSGGTRTAIKLAEEYNIKVTNLFVKEDLERVQKYLSK
jgi:hypothetical protein